MVEPKLPSNDAEKSQAGYKFTAQGEVSAHEKDVDVDFSSLHHTIGKGPTQVAAGDHRHQATDISGLTIDHGGLTGLDDDDHIAYPTKTGGRASGTWGINVTGNAGTATTATTANDSAALGGDAASRFGRVWTYDPGAGALRTGDLLLY